MAADRLFSPLKMGSMNLKHRIVMAPLTRFRADDDNVPVDIVKDYYAQRASTPGTLLISEATLISPRASGLANVPGIWNARQIAAWKNVTTAVHDKGCFIFCQLWALGRRANAQLLQGAEGGPYPVVSASDVPFVEGDAKPHVLSADEIRLFVDDYAAAARNAMAAGFDGVEIHGANGYLPDQFLQKDCNLRTDEYGGSVERRTRFALEVTRAAIAATGDSKKVAVRLSPWTSFVENKRVLDADSDPVPQFSYVVAELKGLDLAYLHLVESRYAGDVASAAYHVLTRRNDPFIEIWGSEAPLILAGGFTPDTARKAANEFYWDKNLCVAFGRLYISTPDLPYRVKENLPLNAYQRKSFYLKMSPEGYIDYPALQVES
jgi:NADPH2 dehydrogenase